MKTILEIKDLKIYKAADSTILVDGIDLKLNEGESLGIVGESGSGKTLTLKSIIGLMPEGVHIEAEVLKRCPETAMTFQDPVKSLDPLMPVGELLTEAYRTHHRVDKAAATKWVKNIIKRLSLTEEILGKKRYPGSLSGGQCQRIGIAIALACEPRLLLCDEPTTALDVTVQKKTLELIKELQAEYGFAMIFVSHNLAAAASVCDRLMVLKQGRVIEEGNSESIMKDPREEYTKALVGSVLAVPKACREEKNTGLTLTGEA